VNPAFRIGNLSGGTISTTATGAGNAAIDVFANAAITNSGTISAGTAASASAANAIRVSSGVSAASTTIVNNSGASVKTTGTGSAILVQSAITSISNSGTIQSTAGTGVEVTANGSITSGITNTATGSIIGGGGDAIDARNSANALTINNAGTITGNIRLGSGANVVNVTGGTISGQIFAANPTSINYSGTTTVNGIVGAGTVTHSAGTLTIASGISATSSRCPRARTWRSTPMRARSGCWRRSWDDLAVLAAAYPAALALPCNAAIEDMAGKSYAD
jgi:hypothetical protein